MKFKASKAKTLKLLTSKLKIFHIPKVIYFTVIDFLDNPDYFVDLIHKNFNLYKIAIRSSASDEDSLNKSAAGEYESVLNIDPKNPTSVVKAINKVMRSYNRKDSFKGQDEIMVQRMIDDSVMSGVIFTNDLNTGAPYYVINYDDVSGLTNTVTSGDGEYSNRTLYIHRNSVKSIHSDRFKKLILAVKELETVLESSFLDIEFAIDKDLTPYLFQVRAITTIPNWSNQIAKRIDSRLMSLKSNLSEKFKRKNGAYGKTTVFGQMPDWNPVEMIGRAPRALSVSLYQELITNSAWSKARELMGYQVPKSHQLMEVFAGQPFIDTRLSFHSFIPNNISKEISEKLVDKWVEDLKQKPALHDKIEFEVAITTFSFDINKRIDRLIGDELNSVEKNEFKEAHRKQTIKLVKGEGDGSIRIAIEKINKLDEKHNELRSIKLKNDFLSLSSIINDCITLGTIPFSILARHGFIAKTILLSLCEIGIISVDEVDQIQGSVRTVASDLITDMRSLQAGELKEKEFMKKYGHLRPGTYDIQSLRYDQMKSFSSNSNPRNSNQHSSSFSFSKEQQIKINMLLEENGFNYFNANQLLDYIQQSIIGREYGKFIFTRSVSDILELIASFAHNNGLTRNEISHIHLKKIMESLNNNNANNLKNELQKISKEESRKHEVSVAIRLPQLLTDEDGVFIIPFQVSYPNFITQKKITAPIEVLNTKIDEFLLDGKIVVIEGADPGFDWIFSQKILGLITKYGGANSHMAIRCAEFSIPAAIGCGEQRFDLIVKSNNVHIDCASGIVTPIH
jgi:glutamine kinase